MIARTEEQSDDFKHLDFSEIRFPSDALSVADLRRTHPDLFDKGFSSGAAAQPQFFLDPFVNGHSENTLGNMLYCERELAASAYAHARGIDSTDLGDVADIKEELSGYYTRYGIANGVHHAGELIRGIESQGAALAKQKPR